MGAVVRRTRVALGGSILISLAIDACGGRLFEPSDDLSSTPNERDAGPSDANRVTPDATTDAGPSFNADGWMQLEGFDPACKVFVAPSPSAHGFPPPIAWKPCDPPVLVNPSAGGDAGVACQEMADNFDGGVLPAPYPSPFGVTESAFVDRTSQRVLLPVERVVHGNTLMVLVADADGPVHQAFTIGPNGPGGYCGIGYYDSLTANDVIYRLDDYGPDGLTEIASAAIGGAIDGMVHVLRVQGDGGGELERVAAGVTVFADREYFSGTHVAPWDDTSASTVWQTYGDEMAFQGDDLFSSAFDFKTEISLTTNTETVPFISFGSDPEATATDFGTDGVDMVWIEAFDELGYEGPWSTVNIMTAPFTTNPSSIVRRRLRSETTPQPGDRAFTVGCGYSAHEYADTNESGIRIVRVLDGRSWRIVTHTADRPLAITCSEIFINFGEANARTARIRLDSLGPGDPPD